MITVKPDSPYFNTADEKLEEISEKLRKARA